MSKLGRERVGKGLTESMVSFKEGVIYFIGLLVGLLNLK